MNILGSAYKHLFKPLAFRYDPEFVHDRILVLGKLLGKTSLGRVVTHKLFSYSHPALKQTLLGIDFPNPIGLSAGFDKNAELLDILPSVGFGFAEVGSITGEACDGNLQKRLWRLPKSQSLVVYYGLKNDGAEKIAARLKHKKFQVPIGISVAKTNSPTTVDVVAGIKDYAKAYEAFADIGSYTTINISCPNTYGGQPFTDPALLEQLLSAIDKIPSSKPVFVKLSPDLGMDGVDQLLAVIDKHNVQGIVCSNLTKNRNNSKIIETEVPEVGGFSGKVVEDLANELISHVYRKTQGKYIVIGSGGVFSAEDAYKKIKLGASLIQMITGMVYQGPQIIGEINQGLVKLLARDGYSNVRDAVGVDNK
jgi:dihydroorotate dehydrogenase